MGEPARSFLSTRFSRSIIRSAHSFRSILGSDRIFGTLQEGQLSGLHSVHCGQHHVTLSADLRQSALLQSTRHVNPNPPGRWRQPCARLGAAPHPGRPRQSRRPTPRGPPPSPQGRRQQESLHRLQRESREGRRSCPAAALKLFVEPRGAHSASHGVLGGTRAPRARARPAQRERERELRRALCTRNRWPGPPAARIEGRADGPRGIDWAVFDRAVTQARIDRGEIVDAARFSRIAARFASPDAPRCSFIFQECLQLPSAST